MPEGRKRGSNWGLLLLPVSKEDSYTFCTMLRIGLITARQALQW